MNQKVLIISKHESLRQEICELLFERSIAIQECIGLELDRAQNGTCRGFGPDKIPNSYRLQDYGMVIIDADSLDKDSTPGTNIARTFREANKLVVWIGEAALPSGVVVIKIFALANYLKSSPELNAFKVRAEA